MQFDMDLQIGGGKVSGKTQKNGLKDSGTPPKANMDICQKKNIERRYVLESKTISFGYFWYLIRSGFGRGVDLSNDMKDDSFATLNQ